MRDQGGDGFRGDFAHRFLQLLTKSRDEMIDEQQKIIAAFAQRRQVDGEDVEPKIEVLAKLRLFEELLKIGVGGGDEANIGGDGVIAADAFELLLLDQAQNFRLGERRHFTDFVEKNRAAVALLEFADAFAIGAGEARRVRGRRAHFRAASR